MGEVQVCSLEGQGTAACTRLKTTGKEGKKIDLMCNWQERVSQSPRVGDIYRI